ncbi:MAG: AAA family ATPase [Candidatus Methanoplasma sp.]|jgi:uncharacterized protein YhaN|nr:AAA family ATPase [Candidatus Methanoplasma sp.]
MHVRSLKIDRFGGLKGRDIEFSDKMNIVYGPNESGKTTIMEFVRSTLFPGKQRNNYPLRSKTDAGSVTVDMGGILKEIDWSDGGCGIQTDASTYRSIFAMTSDDLRDYKTISSGDIRNRFLTVPGGKGLPDVMAGLNKEMSALMTTDRRTASTTIGRLITDIDEKKKRLGEAKDGDNYDALYRERRSIEENLKAATAEAAARAAAEAAASVRASQKANVDALNGMKEQSAALSASDVVKDEHKEKYDSLRADANAKEESFKMASKTSSEILPEGYDHEKILANGDSIRSLSERLQIIMRLKSERESPTYGNKGPVPRKENSNLSVNVSRALFVIGMGLLFAGAALGVLPLVAVGLVVAVCGLPMTLAKRGRTPVDVEARPRADSATLDSDVEKYEREVAAVAAAVGLRRTSLSADVRTMSNLLEKAGDCKRELQRTKDAELASKTASSELREFLSVFGGEEMFLKLHIDHVRRSNLELRIEALGNSIVESGYYLIPDKESPPDRSADITDMNIRFGEISAQMGALVDDGETDRLRDELAADESSLALHARRWGVLSLALGMIDEACSDIYSGVQPAVVSTADGLLALMTDGRYRLDLDPRNSDISVVSGADSKKENQWSSGLGDQVKLSIKLAVARELSDERLPIILDDVLLTFDSKRKRGACKALRKLSEDMQIILFTCDHETASMMKEEGCEPIEI